MYMYLSLSLYIYIYMYICIHIHIYIYIYTPNIILYHAMLCYVTRGPLPRALKPPPPQSRPGLHITT